MKKKTDILNDQNQTLYVPCKYKKLDGNQCNFPILFDQQPPYCCCHYDIAFQKEKLRKEKMNSSEKSSKSEKKEKKSKRKQMEEESVVPNSSKKRKKNSHSESPPKEVHQLKQAEKEHQLPQQLSLPQQPPKSPLILSSIMNSTNELPSTSNLFPHSQIYSRNSHINPPSSSSTSFVLPSISQLTNPPTFPIFSAEFVSNKPFNALRNTTLLQQPSPTSSSSLLFNRQYHQQHH